MHASSVCACTHMLTGQLPQKSLIVIGIIVVVVVVATVDEFNGYL